MAGLNRLVGANLAYRTGVTLALVTAFLTVWGTIVRDDGNGAGFFLVIMAAAVGAFATWFRAAGMARTMIGVAAMQIAFGIAIATAPVTASVAGAPLKALLFSVSLAALWLLSATFFAAAATRGR